MTKLLNVIGGLEKHTIPKMSMFIDGVEIGHNQLCNREVEVDWKEIDNIIIEETKGLDSTRTGIAKAISKAIEQGKVIKVKE